jgi:hypothetical protein
MQWNAIDIIRQPSAFMLLRPCGLCPFARPCYARRPEETHAQYISLLPHLSAVLLELPVSVVQRADLSRLEPSRDAVEVEGMLSCVSFSVYCRML